MSTRVRSHTTACVLEMPSAHLDVEVDAQQPSQQPMNTTLQANNVWMQVSMDAAGSLNHYPFRYKSSTACHVLVVCACVAEEPRPTISRSVHCCNNTISGCGKVPVGQDDATWQLRQAWNMLYEHTRRQDNCSCCTYSLHCGHNACATLPWPMSSELSP